VVLLQRVAAPPGPYQGVALDHLLQPAQEHRAAEPAARQSGRNSRREPVRLSWPQLEEDEVLGHPPGPPGPSLAAADPATVTISCQRSKREPWLAVLFCVKQHPAVGRDGRLGARPILKAGFDARVLRDGPWQPALDGLAHSRGLGSGLVPPRTARGEVRAVLAPAWQGAGPGKYLGVVRPWGHGRVVGE